VGIVKPNKFLDALVSSVARTFERRESPLPPGGVNIVIGFGIGMRVDGSPSLLSEAVAFRCARLYIVGLAKMIIFTGGASENDITEAEAMKKVAVAAGVPEEFVFVEQSSRNIHQNALYVWAMIKEHGLAKDGLCFATVGHRLHAGRCFDSIERVFPKCLQIFLLKAHSEYDPECTQRRLGSEWKFLPWEIVWTILFKIKFVRWLIS